MKCPYCGAETKNDVCEYCGAELPKEKSNTTVNIVNNYYGTEPTKSSSSSSKSTQRSKQNQTPKEPKKKSRTWLWVLGWIFCFPIPLTVLILRQKKIKPVIRYALVAALWIIILISGSVNDSDSASSTETFAVENTTTSAEAEESMPETQVYFKTDKLVNQFIIDYQNIAGYELTDIHPQTIKSYGACYAGNCYLEIFNNKGANSKNLELSINFGDCEKDEIFAVTSNCLKTFGASDEEISKTLTAFTTENEGDYMVENYATNDSITCKYIPTKGEAKNRTIGRIDISSSNYSVRE